MSTDVIGRRRAVEQRLARARTLASSLEEATATLATSSGQPIDVLDPDGSLRTALSALAGVAALRPRFDVMVALPGALFALRVLHTDDGAVGIEVLQRDGPDESARIETTLTVAVEADPDSGQVASDLAAMLWQTVGEPAGPPAPDHPDSPTSDVPTSDHNASRTRETPR